MEIEKRTSQSKEISPSSQNRPHSEENRKEKDKGDSSHIVEDYDPQSGKAATRQNLESRQEGDSIELQSAIQKQAHRPGQQQQEKQRMN